MIVRIVCRSLGILVVTSLLLIGLTRVIGSTNPNVPTLIEHHRVIYMEDETHALRVPLRTETLLVRRAQPVWSPDHTRIACKQWDAVTGGRSVAVIAPFSRQQQVYRLPVTLDVPITWSVDGTRLVYRRGYQRTSAVAVLDVTTGRETILPPFSTDQANACARPSRSCHTG